MSIDVHRPARTSVRVPEQLAHVSDLSAHVARKAAAVHVPEHPAVLYRRTCVERAVDAVRAARSAYAAPLDVEPVSLLDLAEAVESAEAHLERVRADAVVILGRTNPGVPSGVLWAHVQGWQGPQGAA